MASMITDKNILNRPATALTVVLLSGEFSPLFSLSNPSRQADMIPFPSYNCGGERQSNIKD